MEEERDEGKKREGRRESTHNYKELYGCTVVALQSPLLIMHCM